METQPIVKILAGAWTPPLHEALAQAGFKVVVVNDHANIEICHPPAPAVSLRDQFALAVVTGLCANTRVQPKTDLIAAAVYEIADACLRAREKT